MKTKLLSLLFCLFILGGVSHAQVTSFLIDMSAGMNQYHKTSMSLRGLFSYSINEHVAFGAGAGIWYSYRESSEFNDYSDFSLELPVFVNVRGNILKNNGGVTPYYSVSAGFLSPLKKAKYEFSHHDANMQPDAYLVYRINEYDKGLFFAPELGVIISDMSFGVEFMYGASNCVDTRSELYIYNGLAGSGTNSVIKDASYIISLKFTIGF